MRKGHELSADFAVIGKDRFNRDGIGHRQVAEAAAPGQSGMNGRAVEGCYRFYVDDVGVIEPEVLGNLHPAIAPGKGQFGRRLESIRLARDLVKRRVRGSFRLRVIEHDRERPAAGLLRGLRVNQIEGPARPRIVLVLLELPALHHRSTIGEFHAVERILNDNRALVRFRRCLRW